MTGTTAVTITLVLPRLSSSGAIVDQNGVPSANFVQTINNSFANLQAVVVAVVAQGNDQASILAQLLTIQGLQENQSGQLVNLAIVNSYTDPANVLTATYANTTGTITIAAHTRVYADGTSVAVDGGTITGLTADDLYYVFYSDPTRVGGAVVYQSSLTATDAAQIGGIHSVGSVTIPDATSTSPSTGTSGGAPGVPPSGPSGGACVAITSYMALGGLAGDIEAADALVMLNRHDDDGYYRDVVSSVEFSRQPCLRITTESGITLVASNSTPITTYGGAVVPILRSVGVDVPVLDAGDFHWEKIVSLEDVGDQMVANIHAQDGTYAAGEKPDRYIFTHNKTTQQQP